MLSIAISTISEMLIAFFLFEILLLLVEGSDSFGFRVVIFILRVIRLVLFDCVSVATVKPVTDASTVVLKSHLLISTDTVEYRSPANTSAACAMVKPLLPTTAA
jgi:hypothetical protein